jgi:hypothetical protein
MEPNEREGTFQMLRNGIALLSILARIAALAGVLYVAILVLGGALAGALQVASKLLPLVALAVAVAAVFWSFVPLARMTKKSIRAATGETAWRLGIVLVAAFVFSPQFGLVSEESMLKWITIGSATLLISLKAYEYFHNWYVSRTRSGKPRGDSAHRSL